MCSSDLADAVFTGIAELQGIDALIPVASVSVGLGIEARHEALGAVELDLGLEGGILIAFDEGGGLLATLAALVGEKHRDRQRAGRVVLLIRRQAAMPLQVEAAAVGPFPFAEALGVGDLAVG